jgi:hypothetical protein
LSGVDAIATRSNSGGGGGGVVRFAGHVWGGGYECRGSEVRGRTPKWTPKLASHVQHDFTYHAWHF